MKPAWDKLMGEYKGNAGILVADVDCTAEGKPLCDSNGVRGFPTIKSGDVGDLQDYKGGRDYDSLAEFAATLGPSCSPSNIDLCDDEQKAKIEAVQAMSDDELKTAVADGEKKMEDAEELFKSEVEKLQATYKQLQEDKEATLAEVKASGLGLYKQVIAANAKAAAAAGHDEL